MKLNIKNGFTFVDADDYDFLSHFSWHLTNGYVATGVYLGAYKKAEAYLHRILFNNPNLNIDHKNGNRLDNRRNNLRLCTQQENTRNSKPRKNKKYSKYKGVTYLNGRAKPWRVRVKVDGKEIIQRYFKSEDEAALNYDLYAKKYFGNFSRGNL